MFYDHVWLLLTQKFSSFFRQYSVGLTAKPVDVRNPSALGNQQDLSSGAYRWAAVLGYYILIYLIILVKSTILRCINAATAPKTQKNSTVDVIQENHQFRILKFEARVHEVLGYTTMLEFKIQNLSTHPKYNNEYQQLLP